MKILQNIEPRPVWKHFETISGVPRGSRKEDAVRNVLIELVSSWDLKNEVDETGNLIVWKKAQNNTSDEVIIMQGHIDMVQQKNNDTLFDFDTEGIKLLIENGWVTADGTTLGADNGIGVAIILAVLENKEIFHPPIEALFTINEEAGMTGARGLDPYILKGKRLLNLDTMDDTDLTVGSAGAIDTMATRSYAYSDESISGYKLTVSGLRGGHSGGDIDKGRGNANKILFRLLAEGLGDIRLSTIESGSLRNAIPREGMAIFSIDIIDEFQNKIDSLTKALIAEYRQTEPELKVELKHIQEPLKLISIKDSNQIISTIMINFNGIRKMSPEIPELVEASNNLSIVKLIDGTLDIINLTRSSVDSIKMNIANELKLLYKTVGLETSNKGNYPGWKADIHSELIQKAITEYEKTFGFKPHLKAVHGGLECGLFKEHYPDLEMVSYGPNIVGAHSPDEKVEINSVQKIWKLTIQLLKII